MEAVFKALADPSRRLLLDKLFERDGQTLGGLESHLPTMSRFGVMKHLRVLEDAELITTRRSGREKLHFLNPVPIRLIHDRWISKYAEPLVGAMAGLKQHLEAEPMETPTLDLHSRTGNLSPDSHRISRLAAADDPRRGRRLELASYDAPLNVEPIPRTPPSRLAAAVD